VKKVDSFVVTKKPSISTTALLLITLNNSHKTVATRH